MNCQADRIPTYDRCRAVAAELAQRVQPVHVAEAPPLPETGGLAPTAMPATPLYLARPKRVGDAKPKNTFQKRDGAPMRETAREAGPTPAMPNPQKRNGRPVITEQRASVIQRHRANGEPYWIAQVRGVNNVRTHLGPHRTREYALAACERFMATGEKPPGTQTAQNRSTIGRKAPPAPRTSIAASKAVAGQEGPRTTWREIAARFQ